MTVFDKSHTTMLETDPPPNRLTKSITKMQTTSYRYATNCPNQQLGQPEEIVDSKVTFKIANTKECGNHHDVHLFYGEKEWIRVAELDVPDNEFTLIFAWRGRVQETINFSPTLGVSRVDDSRQTETRLTFTVPSANQPAVEWEVTGGSPGFKLAVKVKRKSST